MIRKADIQEKLHLVQIYLYAQHKSIPVIFFFFSLLKKILYRVKAKIFIWKSGSFSKFSGLETLFLSVDKFKSKAQVCLRLTA